MHQVSTKLKKHAVEAREIGADVGTLRAIVDDLREHGGSYTPQSNWVTLDPSHPQNAAGRDWMAVGFSDGNVQTRMSSMEKMLDSWIGVAQQKPAIGEPRERFRAWLEPHDPLGLWQANVLEPGVAETLSAADLGTILDLNLISAFIPSSIEPTAILEVGGGYGRLAEGLLNVFSNRKVVMVDAVPASLLYAREFLRRACPDARIGFFYDGDSFDLGSYDCYIVPAWHLERLSSSVRFHACVNIESFQEMAQHQVDRFIELFDELTVPNALIYISNHHDAVSKSDTQTLRAVQRWEYPVGWRRLLCCNSPRSGTPDHPTEIFLKEGGDWSRPNAELLAAQTWHAERRRVTAEESVWDEARRLARRSLSGAARRLRRLPHVRIGMG